MLVRELHDHGVWNAAVADLQRRAVVNHVSNVLADGLLHRADLRQPDFEHRLAAFDCNRVHGISFLGSMRWLPACTGMTKRGLSEASI